MARESAMIAAAGLLLLAVGLSTPIARAHGGRLDRYGCHHDRKHGGYHCHRGGAAVSPPDDDASRALAPRTPPPRNAPGVRPTRPFANCAEARAAGAAPVRRGDPGYGPHLDRDGDGVGCEPRRR